VFSFLPVGPIALMLPAAWGASMEVVENELAGATEVGVSGELADGFFDHPRSSAQARSGVGGAAEQGCGLIVWRRRGCSFKHGAQR